MADPVSIFSAASAIGSLLGGAGSLFSSVKKPEKSAQVPLPVPKEPTVMPVADDEASKRARARQLSAVRQRSGRESTILSDFGSEKLGG